MITEGSKIMIIPSPELTELRLDAMIGEQGVVLEDLTHECRKAKGYMVLISKKFKDEFVWFIPQESASEQD